MPSPRKCIALLALLAALVGCQRAKSGFLPRELMINGETVRYQVFVPPQRDETKPLPVILYLHGMGGMGSDGQSQTTDALGTWLRANPNRVPALIVFPQAHERWVTPEMEARALATLDATIREFRGDERRVYVIGYSVGAAGAWRLAYLHPERFAALIAIAGTVQSAPKLFTPAELRADQQTHAYLHATDPFGALAQTLRALPIAIYHGADDRVVPPEESRRMAEALRAAGNTPHYFSLPGVGHPEVLEKALAEPSWWSWLFQQQRAD